MTGNTFHIVDVFAERRYAGNQLAVVEGGDSLSTEQMQQIAREFDYSETTFIESSTPVDGGYAVRIFTPEEEVPFAGHPTLGTAHILREHIATGASDRVTLNLKAGQIPVTVDSTGEAETLWMKQNQPDFGQEFGHEQVATVLGLESDAVHQEFPVQAVSTGLPTVIVPLKSRDAVERISVDREAYAGFVAGHDAKLILAFCPEPRDSTNHLAARVFAHYHGVPEDPATGSANGCLAGYLAKYEYLDTPAIDVRVEQGYEMGRPSLLHLQADRTVEDMSVHVGGEVISVATGELVGE
ncbi:PhzF family phenazine biosynthesis protein [Haloarcula sediminis]|uniref:PhzF family phenazine biosynthesis protein n=1 Tax=Haloarcula sediminis TaxID=3111777 RepID=UPI002D782709|nr:PhzF family phenazine biosynthesis protein [Haloarcula sp. CK38]